MFSFKLFSKLSALMLCLLLPLLASSVAVAAPFTVTYTDTIAGGSDTPPFNTGEAFTISIVVDNGGASAVSQIWTPADVVSITFSMNDAPNTITTVFSPVVFSFSNGTFITDAAGVLTAVPDNLTDINGGNDELGFSTIASTNDTATPTSFFINGGNGVYHNSDEIGVSNNTARMTNVANNIIAANWTNPAAAMAPATAVPTLSQWAMILLIMLLMTVGLLKTRRHS
jgi:hypothetical protein